jgi:hypothetical protein
MIRVPPALRRASEEAFQSFLAQVSEVVTNMVGSAVDDALERVEGKMSGGLDRVRQARKVAQKRSRRGRR